MRFHFKEFKYCPKCGNKYNQKSSLKEGDGFKCAKCKYEFFQNSKPAVAAIIPQKNNPKNILLTKRAINPKKGEIDLPGGFLNHHEKPKNGLLREIKEEIGIKVKIKKVFSPEIVNYSYQGSNYSIITIYYLTEPIDSCLKIKTDSENINCLFYDISKLIKKEKSLAFGSDVAVLKNYLKYIK